MTGLIVTPSSAPAGPLLPEGRRGDCRCDAGIEQRLVNQDCGGFSFSPRGEGARRADEGVFRVKNSGAGKKVAVFARLLMLLALLFAAAPAFAVNPDEVLSDPALEARARTISAELRCMVCQNQSIDDSNADLARDLRLLVRKRLAGGDTDRQVLDYIVSRYGEFVLLKPRLSEKTYILWGAPILLFIVGGLALVVYARRRAGKPTGKPLSDEEEAQLNEILEK